jgi:hypothetical protein
MRKGATRLIVSSWRRGALWYKTLPEVSCLFATMMEVWLSSSMGRAGGPDIDQYNPIVICYGNVCPEIETIKNGYST